MKRLLLLIMIAVWLVMNLSALTWGGVKLSNWYVYDTESKPK